MSINNTVNRLNTELQVMTKSYNSTDPAQEESEYPTSDRLSSPLISKSAAETQKKLKRNERDRQRSFAKRQSMQQMRLQVKDLEAQKQHLMKRTSRIEPTSPRNYEIRLASPLRSSLNPPATTINREHFLSLTNEIEKFRHQNGVMAKHLREWDVTTGYMQNLLLEYSQNETDSDRNSNNNLIRGPPNVCYTPLTHEEGLTCVRDTLQLINTARIYFANDSNYHNRYTFLGWGQYMLRQGSTIMFSVEKSLPNVTPSKLMTTTWNILTDEQKTKRLIPSTINAHIRLLQKLSDDLLVFDRRTEDNARSGVLGQNLALRTIYVLFRTADADGSQTLAVKTINHPLVKNLLLDDELWCEIFYWVSFCPDGSMQSSSNNGEFATVAEIGGYNTYTRDEIAKAWLCELAFFAIRWEGLAVTPTLLKF